MNVDVAISKMNFSNKKIRLFFTRKVWPFDRSHLERNGKIKIKRDFFFLKHLFFKQHQRTFAQLKETILAT